MSLFLSWAMAQRPLVPIVEHPEIRSLAGFDTVVAPQLFGDDGSRDPSGLERVVSALLPYAGFRVATRSDVASMTTEQAGRTLEMEVRWSVDGESNGDAARVVVRLRDALGNPVFERTSVRRDRDVTGGLVDALAALASARPDAAVSEVSAASNVMAAVPRYDGDVDLLVTRYAEVGAPEDDPVVGLWLDETETVLIAVEPTSAGAYRAVVVASTRLAWRPGMQIIDGGPVGGWTIVTDTLRAAPAILTVVGSGLMVVETDAEEWVFFRYQP